jgi:hypothetical protein
LELLGKLLHNRDAEFCQAEPLPRDSCQLENRGAESETPSTCFGQKSGLDKGFKVAVRRGTGNAECLGDIDRGYFCPGLREHLKHGKRAICGAIALPVTASDCHASSKQTTREGDVFRATAVLAQNDKTGLIRIGEPFLGVTWPEGQLHDMGVTYLTELDTL